MAVYRVFPIALDNIVARTLLVSTGQRVASVVVQQLQNGASLRLALGNGDLYPLNSGDVARFAAGAAETLGVYYDIPVAQPGLTAYLVVTYDTTSVDFVAGR